MSESSADEMLGTPPDIAEAASIVKNDLLPDKSRKRYERERSLFKIWCIKKNVTTLTENVMLSKSRKKSPRKVRGNEIFYFMVNLLNVESFINSQ